MPEAKSEQPAPAPAAPPAAEPPVNHAQEGARFASSAPAVPEGMPERFLRDGKPDYEALTKSYVELDRAFKTKTDDLKEQVKADLFKDRPESADKYALPEDAGITEESGLLAWWREQAHSMGLGQKGFEEGIKGYMEAVQNSVDLDAEKAKLGDNAEARIEAVATWAQKNFTDGEFEVIQRIATSAEGISVLEKLMGANRIDVDVGTDMVQPSVTVEDVRKMQQDPRYWDAARRDPAYVKQIEEAYAKLYG